MVKRLRPLSIELIDNHGPNSLLEVLSDELARAVGADIAVAFTTDAGIDPIYDGLADVARQGTVRFLTGTYQSVTEPRALAALLELQRVSKRRLTARLSVQPNFHWKLYLLHGPSGRLVAIVGSSNLTREGLTSEGEICLLLRGHARQPALARLVKHFNKEWASVDRYLSREQIDEYAAQRGNGPPRAPKLRLGAICRKGGKSTTQVPPAKYWRSSVDGVVGEPTKRQVGRKTNWDKRNWKWFTAWKPLHEDGDGVVVFDFVRRRVKAVRIMASTRLVNSSDGKYAFAYEPLRGIPQRRFGKKLWKNLRDRELVSVKSEAQKEKPMKVGLWNDFLYFLKDALPR